MHVVLETPGGTGLYLSFNVFGWLIATILISLGLWQITLNKKVVTSSLQLYSLLGFLCLCVPMFYGSEFSDHAIPRLLGLAGGLLLLFCLYQFDELRKNPQQVLWWILIAIAIQACFGLVQYFILETSDWAGYKPGISRPHGSFLQPNVMASFMATGIAIALYLSVTSKKFSVNKYQQALCYFCLFSATFLVVVLQSRTGHLTTLLVLAFISPYLYFKHKKQLGINLAIIFVAFAMSIISFNNSEIFNRGEENYQKAGARPHTYLITTQMIKDHPLKGAGYGLYERVFLDTYNRYVIEHPEIGAAQQRMAHPHNEVLYWVSEGGVIALLGMIFFVVAYMKSWLKINNKLAKRLTILGLITPLLLHSQLEFPFYSSVSHWFVFIILLWFTDMHSNSDKSESRLDNFFLLRFLSILFPIIFLPFLITTLHTGNIVVEHEKHGYQNIERLLDIENPIAWQSRLDKNIYGHTLVAGLREKSPQALQRYINWGLGRVRHAPRKSIYSNILLCLGILKQEVAYQRVLKEAKLTYPLVEDWGINIVKSKDD
ncbi:MULTISPECIES: PglL family O-oligosaccharyltransferase [unclassified Colwellia]|uniref:PglL family O-oligosaccharyltransferase n=1 Tax=unclassified Colwellia TaxID=196834 RepID=UPI0015F50714|nr:MULTISPECIES: Wzy polymerase domain-containing protein [unclassified Colwellia]MBA6232097.1 O-antigen ligase C-terminal domain-containing protein [Colwellia sp. MB02u-7]MBA6237205.1 O-antigen ligase C-terminal domain-containing protein [Colwellia sp. MB02u-11]MBA6254707.1 O-antigen ligase C-terminal domain-containing protein [Colwellia sp. MB3u-28]MBA6260435.1 O-antigen ligase C-terminal domain-containing protein [Colwellia sp. MB3u-41]MBA6300228.1 O-antigen ligase C-terminal domain-contain